MHRGVGGFTEGEEGVVVVEEGDFEVLVVCRVVGEVWNGYVEISVVIDDLEGEGDVVVSVDADLSAVAKGGGDVGRSGCEGAGDVGVEDDGDARGVAGIGRNRGKQAKGDEAGSEAEPEDYNEKMYPPIALSRFYLHLYHLPLFI